MKEEEQTEPPHPDVIARLLQERHTLEADEVLTVSHEEGKEVVSVLMLVTDRRRLTIRVKLQRGPQGEAGWMLVADALDALLGTYLENGRQHRELPVGADVRFGATVMQVEVIHEIPELSALADHILAGAPDN